MKSKKQVRRPRNKSKKFRKMKGAGGRFSIPMTIPDNLTLNPQERQEALTMRAPTARDVAQQQRNTELLRMVGAVLQEQQGFPELAILGSATSGVIDPMSVQRMKKDYMKSEGYLNKVKKETRKLWHELWRPELELIFGDFMNIYNNKRPEDSKLRTTDPQNHMRLYFGFIKHTSVDFNEMYKKLVDEDISRVEYMRTSPDTAWAREGNYTLPEQEFFYGFENELLFYESMLEAINNYNNYKNRNRGWGSLQGIVDRVRGGKKRKTKNRNTRKGKTKKH